MKKYLLIGLTVALPAIAEPVLFDCFIINSSNEKSEFQVRFDDSTGDVLHTDLGGRSFTADGAFTTEFIRYQKIRGSELRMTWEYSINRSDLTIIENFTVVPVSSKYQDEPPNEALIAKGSCESADRKDGML